MAQPFLLYGANGYTGELIARCAAERGLRPILAGRNREAVSQLAARYGFDQRVFSLDDTPRLDNALNEAAVVLHCAGPFKHTYQQMASACLRAGAHYLDITGELSVFQGLAALDAPAKEAGVMVLPGVGFDVVPTDCLAVHLKKKMPAAARLKLGIRFFGPARSSRGTARSFIESLPGGGFERKDGELRAIIRGARTRVMDFGRGPVAPAQTTLGDVVSAYHSTGIPDIETYVVLPPVIRRLLMLSRYLRPIAALRPVQATLKSLTRVLPPGPTGAQRERSGTLVWGEVQDESGNRATARLTGPEAYTFTALTALAAVERVLAGEAPPGYQTPGTAFGADFVLGIEEVRREELGSG